MRILLAAAVLAGLSLLVTGAGQAISAKQDFVTGTAQHLGADPPFPVIQVRINARSKADGTRPRGHLAVQGTMPFVQTSRGRVTCLNVVGDQATVGIEIVKSTDPAMVGKGELWSVVDGGATGEDRIAGFPLTPTPPIVCPPLFFNVPVVSGDYRINDAALPASSGRHR
jgi:hypothetical protein